MKIVQVQVKRIPVRYGIKTYQPGETFEMDGAHVDGALVDVIEGVKKEPKKAKTKEKGNGD